MTTFTIYAKTTAAGQGGYAHMSATSGSGNPMTQTTGYDGSGWNDSGVTGSEQIVGTTGTSYREAWEQFYAFDVSSLSGQTVTASNVLLTKSANAVTNEKLIAAQVRSATFADTNFNTGPTAPQWYTGSTSGTLVGRTLYATSAVNVQTVPITCTGNSALNTALGAGGTLKVVIHTDRQVTTNNTSAGFKILVANSNGSNGTDIPRITGTYGSGSTYTADAAVSTSPTVAASGTRTAVASATAVTNSAAVAASATAIQSGSASTTTSPTPDASATVVRAVDAAVTISPTSTASGTVTQSASASVTVSPTSDATATQSTAAKSADAALTTSPTTAATGVRVVTASATNVTISPTTTSAAVRVVLADSSTTVTPSSSGQSAATHNAIAAYALTPLTAAVATVTRTVSASGVTVTIITAAVADIAARRGQMSAATKATATMSATTRTSATMTGA
jgi:hypothetical protein